MSPMSLSSRAVYSTPMSTKTCLAFLQKGQVVKLNITTGEPSMIPCSSACVAATS